MCANDRTKFNDLRPAMKLAADNLINNMNPEQNYMPYWKLVVTPDYHAHFGFEWPCHNLGRWWDAMLRLENATGYEIPPHIEGAMLQNYERFFDNADHWCLDPLDLEVDEFVGAEAHSNRENLLGLTALIKWRGSLWARRAAHALVESVADLLDEDCNWMPEKMDYTKRCPEHPLEIADHTWSHGRFMEALMVYFNETGDQAAFQLAEKLAQWHYDNTMNPDGTITGLDICHTHSYLGTLRGMFLFGKTSGQRRYIDWVKRSYENTVRVLVKESGYASHDMGREDRPETTSPGDAAQLALWLALDGCPELLDDAERIIRARILPAQVLETPPLIPDGEGADRYTDLERRIIGGIGGMLKDMHGGKFDTTDITAADLHTLVDIYNHIVVDTKVLTRVLFHFDYDSEKVTVRSKRDDRRATVTVESKTGKLLEVRVPAWAPRRGLTVTVNGESVEPHIVDGFLRVYSEGESVSVTMGFDLPVKEIMEPTNGVNYRIRFLGDEVIGISPNTDFYPLYPDL